MTLKLIVKFECWLRSSSGLIPYYVNLFRVQLANNLQLVCLAEAKYDHLIRTTILLYDQLQQLAKQVNSGTKLNFQNNYLKSNALNCKEFEPIWKSRNIVM